ncbi:MAG: hydroxyphenylacetyl-CoA thioesterase PaaI [Gammaproteobacteria bacterium]|nr:hydroxyphenylacetyl-CoA thioesterase PaaI [Gammaproteobacteria bacterium]
MSDSDIARKCRDTMWRNDFASQDMGMTVDVDRQGEAQAKFEVRKNMVNGHDLCHGGYIFALADSAFAFACNTYNRVTVASAATIEFVRPAKLGDRLTARAREAHRGGRTGIYDIEVTNQDEELVAIFRGRSYATREPMFEDESESDT